MDTQELIKVAVLSLPEVQRSWVDILSAILTPIIALIALYVAYQQHVINKQRLRHETYERRLRVYKAVQKHLSNIMRKGTITYQECAEFYSEASEAAFLFDDSVQNKIDEIYKKSLDLAYMHEQLYPSDGSPGIPVGEKRNEVSRKHSELLGWHTEQLKVSREFFAKKLGLKHA